MMVFLAFVMGGGAGLIIMGIPIFVFRSLIEAITTAKAQKTIEGYRRVTVESLLSVNHEEITYSQIEKVEVKYKKDKLKFFYVDPTRGIKKKQFSIEIINQQDLELLNSVLPSKVIVIGRTN